MKIQEFVELRRDSLQMTREQFACLIFDSGVLPGVKGTAILRIIEDFEAGLADFPPMGIISFLRNRVARGEPAAEIEPQEGPHATL